MNRNVTFTATALTCGVLGLWGTPAAAQPRMPTHVACVGDSITAGNGSTSSTKTYPANLQSMFGASVKVSNFGHSGATMLSAGDLPYVNQSEYTAATTFVSNAGANAVVDVVLMLGTNDTKSFNWTTSGGGTRMQQFITDCAAMVDHFANLSTHPVVYLALPPKIYNNSFGIVDSVLSSGVIPALMQVAMQKGLPTIDVYTPTAQPVYFGDGVHPTDAGYVVLAEIMRKGLLRVPRISIAVPGDGATFGGGEAITLAVSASGGTVPITSVQFFAGATAIATAMQAPFSATWNDAAAGPYMLTAKATDKTGASATSDPVDITVVGNGGAGGGAGGRGTGGRGGAGGAATGGNGGGRGGSAGAVGTGGAATGGAATGGAATGGTGTGTGGAATGGMATGGAATGGTGTGGAATGGAATGGKGTGGAGTGGAAGSGATGSDAGCACDVGAGGAPSIGTLALLLAALGMRRSRRRPD